MSSSTYEDKREYPRYFAISKILSEDNTLLGFLSDISMSGVKLWIDNSSKNMPISKIKVCPMDKKNYLSSFLLEIKPIRRIDHCDFIEIGAEICNIVQENAFSQYINWLEHMNEIIDSHYKPLNNRL